MLSPTRRQGRTLIEPAAFEREAVIALDFTRSRYRVGRGRGFTRGFSTLPGLTVTRASTGYAETSSGLLVPCASGVARITDKGLLVEEQRTQLARNAAFNAWAGVAPDGYSSPIGGRVSKVSGVLGANALKINGPFPNDGNRVGIPSAGTLAASSSYTLTVRARRTRGAAQLHLALDSWGSSPFSFDMSAIPINEWRTLTVTATTPGVAPGGSGGFHTNGADGDVEIDWWQLEAGAFGTSFIPNDSTGASATRAADVVSIGGLSVGSAATLVASVFSLGTVGGQRAIANLSAGDGNHRASIIQNSGDTGAAFRVTVGGVQSHPSAVGNLTQGPHTIALTVTAGMAKGAADGIVSAAASAPSAMPAVNRLNLGLGENITGQEFNGYLRRVLIYPRAFTDSELQAATAA